MSTVSILMIRTVVQYLKNEGFDIQKLFEIAKEDMSMLMDADYRVTEEQMNHILEAAYALTGDASIGFKAGKLFRFNNLGMLGYFMENSYNGQDVYDKLLKYQYLLGSGIHTTMDVHDSYFELHIDSTRDVSTLTNRICIDKIITQNIQGMRDLTDHKYDPIAVFIKYAQPDDHEEFEAYLKCPVHYGAEQNVIRLPIRILSERIIQYNQIMEDQFSTMVQNQLEKLFANEDFASKVSMHIYKHYPSCDVEAEKVASDFNMGLRTFQRRLKAENSSFKSIIDEVKKRIAINYVQSNTLALSEISYIMGFSEISSFYRSFKRWTGQTPKSYRTLQMQ